MGTHLTNAARSRGIHVTTFWAGWPGPATWNLHRRPAPSAWCRRSTARPRRGLKQAADFAADCGFPSITTHVGFLPEDSRDPQFERPWSRSAKWRSSAVGGAWAWFETGQETPVTLLRTIERVGTDNLGIN
jgi:hypothetical protein